MRLLMIWFLAILALAGSPAHAELPARPAGAVLDQAGVIPDAEEAALDQKLRAYNAATGRAVMVVTVTSLDGDDIATYGSTLGRAWGVGGKATDQGLILLIAPSERKLRIEVGYGLEEFMPDVLAGRIIRETITPRFKAGDYAGGISAGVAAITTQLDRNPADAKAQVEAAEAAARNRGSEDTNIGSAIFWIFLILMFMLMFGRRRRGAARSGIDPGIVLWGISEIAHHASRGGFGGGGGGGSDWGGFGGGDFGGGGASGDW